MFRSNKFVSDNSNIFIRADDLLYDSSTYRIIKDIFVLQYVHINIFGSSKFRITRGCIYGSKGKYILLMQDKCFQ